MNRPHAGPAAAGLTALLCAALSAGCGHSRLTAAPEPATSPPATPPPTGSPGAGSNPASATPPAPAPPPVPPVPAGPARTAAGYVTALNTHDARPGHDQGLHDANTRTRRYVTDGVYAQIENPQTRTSPALWQQLVAGGAVTSVRVDKVAVPEGAPAPTTQHVEVRITYTVTTTGARLHHAQTLAQAMQVSATPAGWRIDQLLPF
jgi:hypothetical protein